MTINVCLNHRQILLIRERDMDVCSRAELIEGVMNIEARRTRFSKEVIL